MLLFPVPLRGSAVLVFSDHNVLKDPMGIVRVLLFLDSLTLGSSSIYAA